MITGETYQPCNPKYEMGVSLLKDDRRGFSKLRALELLSLVSRVSSGHSEAIERRSVTSRYHDLDQQSFLTEAAICID